MKKVEELIETKEVFRKRLYDDIRDDFYDERKSKQIAIVLGSLAIGLFVKNYVK